MLGYEQGAAAARLGLCTKVAQASGEIRKQEIAGMHATDEHNENAHRQIRYGIKVESYYISAFLLRYKKQMFMCIYSGKFYHELS